MDILADNIAKLKEIFPEVFCEDKDYKRFQVIILKIKKKDIDLNGMVNQKL